MRFLKPNGLWLLLAVPILILVYIIKAQHEDRPVSSTYIWKLSNKFLKKKLPMQRFRRILLFTLQLLAIVTAALLAARPAIVKGQVKDYILILDASGSMQTVDEEGISRYDRALAQMDMLTKEMDYGNRISVIQASSDPSILLELTDSQSEVKLTLQNMTCRSGGMDLDAAMSLAARISWKSANPQVILYTDRQTVEGAAENAVGVTVVDMTDPENEWDVSVKLDGYTVSTEEKATTFNGSVCCTGKNKRISVGLRVDGKILDAAVFDCYDGIALPVSFTQNLTLFDTAELFVSEEDGLFANNCDAICKQNVRNCTVLLASESPLYLESALDALGNCEVTSVSDFDEQQPYGYDLYIFDRILPDFFPTDGSMILIEPNKLPAGLAYGKEYDREGKLTLNSNTPDDVTEGLLLRDTVISSYCALIGNASWTTELTCNYSSVLATKRYDTGLSCAVLSFDLHDTNLTLQQDYLLLMRNLVHFCAPSLLPKTDYEIEETVTVSLLPGAQSLYMRDPDGGSVVLPTSEARAYYAPAETGCYTVVQTGEEGGAYSDFFVHMPESELEPAPIDQLPSVQAGLQEEETKESLREIGIWVALLLLILLLAEWGVYYYDQY